MYKYKYIIIRICTNTNRTSPTTSQHAVEYVLYIFAPNLAAAGVKDFARMPIHFPRFSKMPTKNSVLHKYKYK